MREQVVLYILLILIILVILKTDKDEKEVHKYQTANKIFYSINIAELKIDSIDFQVEAKIFGGNEEVCTIYVGANQNYDVRRKKLKKLLDLTVNVIIVNLN